MAMKVICVEILCDDGVRDVDTGDEDDDGGGG